MSPSRRVVVLGSTLGLLAPLGGPAPAGALSCIGLAEQRPTSLVLAVVSHLRPGGSGDPALLSVEVKEIWVGRDVAAEVELRHRHAGGGPALRTGTWVVAALDAGGETSPCSVVPTALLDIGSIRPEHPRAPGRARPGWWSATSTGAFLGIESAVVRG